MLSGGGTSSDGVDGMATKSAAEDELQIIVYDAYSTVKTTGSDSVTVNVSNLPAALAGKEVFVTQFLVDETHSNPYSVWVAQGKPKNPTEAQWQDMRKAQHLALAQPVAKKTVDTSFTTSFTLNRQGATLILVGLKRPLTGRGTRWSRSKARTTTASPARPRKTATTPAWASRYPSRRAAPSTSRTSTTPTRASAACSCV